ncbi:hypothetical protein BH11PLA2_BH11PLA2_40800 [soil metagenome]
MNVLFLTLLLTVAEPATQTHVVKLNGHTFTLPVGFGIELVAGPPLVQRPIHADFDDHGVLYVTDSSGSNDKIEVQLAEKPHRVIRLEDTTSNGRFDKASTFADRMMFPEGAMWRDGSLYIAAPPSIWKLTDTKGTGVADQRVEWFQGKTLTGCANDLHGPYAGPDGWIYWCKGAFAKQEYPRDGKPAFTTRVSHIFRARPDGSGVEAVMTGGMENPVGLAFSPAGDRIFSCTFHTQPGGGQRDGLIHAVYGGVYGRIKDGLQEHLWTGPDVMPVLTHMGAAAPSGIKILESDFLGKEFKGHLFATQFNMHKVSLHVLVPDGATFKTVDSDFLTSDNFDFHPTDVLEDADGSLLVIDTGGWYKLCCPSSQMAKTDILGAIYRIRRTDAKPIDDPRGLTIEWAKLSQADLASLLDNPRPVVRKKVIAEFVKAGTKSLEMLGKILVHSESFEVKRNAIWALTQIDDPTSRKMILLALGDKAEAVRAIALHSIALHRNPDELSVDLAHLLGSNSAAERRAAAEVIGRMGDVSEVPTLLKQLGRETDRVTEHSLIYALFEIGDAASLTKGLDDTNPSIRRGALTALDQMPGKHITIDHVRNELTAKDAKLRATAWWIAGRHPEWGDDVAGVLRQQANELRVSKGDPAIVEFKRRLVAFSRSKAVQELIAELARNDQLTIARTAAFAAMQDAHLKETPAIWFDVLMARLENDTIPWFDAVATIRIVKLSPSQAKQVGKMLRTIGSNEREQPERRRSALAAISGGVKELDTALFEFLRTGLQKEQNPQERSRIVSIFATAKLDSPQLIALTELCKAAGPMEIDRLIDAFAHSKDAVVGTALLEALSASPIRTSLRIDRLRTIFDNCKTDAKALYVMIDADAEKQKTKLQELLPKIKGGDVRRGQAVYVNAKVQCTACHAMGYTGGTIGPDLTHIGKIRTEGDLLESILFPSASLVRSYEPVKVNTTAGTIHNGLIRAETPAEVTLQLGIDQQVRIARDDIETMVPGKISIMPAGLDQQLTTQDLADLIAFLKSRQ